MVAHEGRGPAFVDKAVTFHPQSPARRRTVARLSGEGDSGSISGPCALLETVLDDLCLSAFGDVEKEARRPVTVPYPIVADLVALGSCLDLMPRLRAVHVTVPQHETARTVDIDVVPESVVPARIRGVVINLGVFDHDNAIWARIRENTHLIVVEVAVADGQTRTLGANARSIAGRNPGPGELQILHRDPVPLDDPNRFTLSGVSGGAQVWALADTAQRQIVLAPNRHVPVVAPGIDLHHGAVARNPRGLAGPREPLSGSDL